MYAQFYLAWNFNRFGQVVVSDTKVKVGFFVVICWLQGMELIFRVGVALLLLNSDELRCLDMEETIQVRSLPVGRLVLQ